jgi:hypothetical protein
MVAHAGVTAALPQPRPRYEKEEERTSVLRWILELLVRLGKVALAAAAVVAVVVAFAVALELAARLRAATPRAKRRARDARVEAFASRWQAFGQSRGLVVTTHANPPARAADPVPVRVVCRGTRDRLALTVEITADVSPPEQHSLEGVPLPGSLVRVSVASLEGAAFRGTPNAPLTLGLADVRCARTRKRLRSQLARREPPLRFEDRGTSIVLETPLPRRLRWVDTLLEGALDLAGASIGPGGARGPYRTRRNDPT